MSDDPRGTFRAAIDQTGRIVSATPADAKGAATPCTEFDVRRLFGHLDAVLRRLAHVMDGGHPFDVPHVVEGIADDDWVRTWKADAAELGLRLDDDTVLDRTLMLPFGPMSGRVAIGAYASELTTHSWDLASAIGRRDLLDDRLAEGSLPMMERILPAEPRGGPVPFGDVVPVAADASAYERLVAWMGRDPAWRAVAE